jgi:uncharacterized protein YidB (DUF937 family)
LRGEGVQRPALVRHRHNYFNVFRRRFISAAADGVHGNGSALPICVQTGKVRPRDSIIWRMLGWERKLGYSAVPAEEGRMGLFDGILGGVIGVEGATLLNKFIENQGGLQSIVSQFEKNGFGDTVKSWISLGPNSPITTDQIRQVLGSEKVKELAAKLGLPSDKLAELLAQHLPQAVDTATPDGKLPS